MKVGFNYFPHEMQIPRLNTGVKINFRYPPVLRGVGRFMVIPYHLTSLSHQRIPILKVLQSMLGKTLLIDDN